MDTTITVKPAWLWESLRLVYQLGMELWAVYYKYATGSGWNIQANPSRQWDAWCVTSISRGTNEDLVMKADHCGCPPPLCDGLAGTASSTKSNLPRQLRNICNFCIGATGLFPIAMHWLTLCNLINSTQFQLNKTSFPVHYQLAAGTAINIYSRYGTIILLA